MNPLNLNSFQPEGFFSGFFTDDSVLLEDKRKLFYHLFFDLYYTEHSPVEEPNSDRKGFFTGTDTDLRTNERLRSLLPETNSGARKQSFLSKTIKSSETAFENHSIIEYIVGFLSHNDYEQFYLFLYRMDCLWNASLSPSGSQQLDFLNDQLSNSKMKRIQSVMKMRFDSFLKKNSKDEKTGLEKCFDELSKYPNTQNLEDYLSYIDVFSRKKKSYAYALMVLWSVINVYVVWFLPALDQIILYKDEPTTEFDENKHYIIRSVLNENLYLSILKTLEPLSCSEKKYSTRNLLYSVNAGKFHRETSIVEFIKCADFDGRNPETVPAESPKLDFINQEKAKGFLTSALDKVKDFFTMDTAANLRGQIKGLFSRKTESYYILINGRFLTYEGWFSDTRISLKEQREETSRWCFTESPNKIAIFNSGFWANIFAMDIPNGGQFAQTLMWCFPAFSQKAQRFTVHEVIDWKSSKNELDSKRTHNRKE